MIPRFAGLWTRSAEKSQIFRALLASSHLGGLARRVAPYSSQRPVPSAVTEKNIIRAQSLLFQFFSNLLVSSYGRFSNPGEWGPHEGNDPGISGIGCRPRHGREENHNGGVGLDFQVTIFFAVSSANFIISSRASASPGSRTPQARMGCVSVKPYHLKKAWFRGRTSENFFSSGCP